MGNWGRYELERSPLFRAGNKRKLCRTLQVSLPTVREITSDLSVNYLERCEVVNGKQRDIQLPLNRLRRIHERAKSLLERIVLRDCIMSPRAGMTIRQNAVAHADNTVIASFDVRRFYPSTSSRHVFTFFRNKLQMTADCADLMTQLATYKGALPFGSPLSPILCAHVHGDLFGGIERVARDHDLKVTAWVDDVVVSGRGRLAGALWKMRRLVASTGLRTHKVVTQTTRKGASVTGTVLLPTEVHPSNDVHLKIRVSISTEPGPRIGVEKGTALSGRSPPSRIAATPHG